MDEHKLEQQLGKVLSDFGAGGATVLIWLGDRLGLWRALAATGPVTSERLAAKTGYAERYLREWLAALAAQEYLTYDPQQGTFSLPEELGVILADETSPASLIGFFASFPSLVGTATRLADAFESGEGIGWTEHDHAFHIAQERLTRPQYETSFVEWISAAEGVEEKLRAGAKVADVGCGSGISTIVLAREFPNSTFYGFDFDDASIARARKLAAEEGVADRVTFEIAAAETFPGDDYDLITFVDCFHDFGRPEKVAARAHQALKPNGTLLLVELQAGDRVEDNFNPLGRVLYFTSTLLCVPNALSQDGDGEALGNQPGESRLRDIVLAGGFNSVRRATETPLLMILEAKP